MDVATLAILAFIAIAGIVMLGRLLGHLIHAAAIVAALLNDLVDLGIVCVGGATAWLASWIGDITTFILILLAYRNAGALISLLDMVPILRFLPLHTIALLVSWKLRKEEMVYVSRRR